MAAALAIGSVLYYTLIYTSWLKRRTPQSTVIGGVAGALIGSAVGNLSPLLSLPLTIKGLVTAVLGGLGSIPGAIAGGLLLGVVEYQALYFFGIGYRDMVTYLMLFAFLVFRPGGLFGQRAGR